MTPDEILAQYGPRESMEYDVVDRRRRSGGTRHGDPPEAARRRAQATRSRSCVLEKGSEPGAHILSGAIMDPRALDELLPDWKAHGAPLHQPVTGDRFLFLTEGGAHGDAATSCCPTASRTTATTSSASATSCAGWRSRPKRSASRSFPAFAAAEVLYDETARCKGVATGNLGIGKDGEPTENFQLGMELHAQVHGLRRGLARQPGQAADRAASSSTQGRTRRATASA